MKLFIIDGHALIFKMYYAFQGRPMINSKGVDTSILFGFTKYLLELIEKEQPTHIAVSFDPPGGTFRNKLYPQYKANRGETPQLVIDALEPLTAIVKAMNIPVVMIPGFEADDVIGSMAKRFATDGLDVYMVTPDKDYGQLVGGNIMQFKPGKAGGENEVLDASGVCAKWGISDPLQVIDILAICGDASDNVPGVQGVGPVGASKLLQKYGSVEGIYEHIGELTPRQAQMFTAAEDHIALSKTLVTIKTDIPLELSLEDMVFDMAATPELLGLFDTYEFFSLKKKALSLAPGSAPHTASAAKPESAPDLSFEEARASELSGKKMSFILKGDQLFAYDGRRLAKGEPEAFRTILEDAGVVKAGVDMKSLMKALSVRGIILRGKLEDVELMHYLLNPERSHKLQALSQGYLGINLEDDAQASTGSLFDDAPEEDNSATEKETVAVLLLSDCLSKELSASGMGKLYDEVEEPLVGVLSRMETNGVKVDMASLRDFADGLRKTVVEKEAQIRELAGNPSLNPASPKQIGETIFEKMRLDPKAKKPKNGNWPTDEQTLLDLADRSPIIDAILDYRGTRKLLSTYIEPFPSYVSAVDGRVHTTFNQALTSTGRLSSSNPNLQNIPIRTEQGREIRKAFVPEGAGSVMMSADYSQIELRVMAHICQDEHLCAAFRQGIDVHSATAAKIFGVPVESVTAEQRRVAKTANFGIMYGISAFGLSQRLKCSRTEAKQIIDDYFASFPSIRGFIDGTLSSARRDGYVETLFGRRRYIPDVNSHNANLRAFAERNAVNAPIQGTAADIIKMAMVAVDRRLEQSVMASRMVLQIHDELLLEVPETEIEAAKALLVSEMENVVALSIPLTVECNYGKTWLEAH